MKDKSIFITGANGGLGLETTKLLAELGFKRIVMAARTKEKAIAAKSKLLNQAQPRGVIEAVGGFDMNRPDAIEAAVAELPKNKAFDIVFLQAGGVVFEKDYQYIKYAGRPFEKTIFQNVIGGYITLLSLMKHGLIAPSARIVYAGGEGARGIPGMIDKPVFDTPVKFRDYLSGEGTQNTYNPMNAIGVSKLASALLVQKLATLNDGLEYIWFSPGLTHGTNGLSGQSPIKRFFMEKIMFGISGLLGFSQSPHKGAQKYVDCLIGKIGSNGEILGAPDGKVLGEISDQKPMNPSLSDIAIIEEFWSILQAVYPLPTQTAKME